MQRLLALLLIVSLAAVAGCRGSGFNITGMFDGVNSDQEHGGGYAKVPVQTGDGEWQVREPDRSAGQDRVW